MSMRGKKTKTAGDRINTATQKMKKLFLMIAIMLGFAFGANAQSDQCEIKNGNGAYVSAWVTSKVGFSKQSQFKSSVEVTIKASDASLEGNVIVEITYIAEKDGEKKTETFNGDYKKGQSTENSFNLGEQASKLVDINIYGATCTSARKRW